jgi:hypothetical protein
MGGVFQEGDSVANIGTTACGLVLGFGTDGVAAYHWPFMTPKDDYLSVFQGYVTQAGRVSHIEIYVNQIPDSQRQDYEQTASLLKSTCRCSVSLYEVEDSNGHPLNVTLKQNKGTPERKILRSTLIG